MPICIYFCLGNNRNLALCVILKCNNFLFCFSCCYAFGKQIQAWQEEVEKARQSQREAESKISSLEVPSNSQDIKELIVK
jgi:hypothetical protein